MKKSIVNPEAFERKNKHEYATRAFMAGRIFRGDLSKEVSSSTKKTEEKVSLEKDLEEIRWQNRLLARKVGRSGEYPLLGLTLQLPDNVFLKGEIFRKAPDGTLLKVCDVTTLDAMRKSEETRSSFESKADSISGKMSKMTDDGQAFHMPSDDDL